MLLFQCEDYHEILPEIKPLLELHWREIALNQDEVKLNPDFTLYEKFWNDGNLLIVTARDEELRLVGYTVYLLVQRLLHYQDVCAAENDIFWLHPDYRKGSNGVRLFIYAEKVLRELGVNEIYTRTKLGDKDVGKLFERLKYKPVERVYKLVLGY